MIWPKQFQMANSLQIHETAVTQNSSQNSSETESLADDTTRGKSQWLPWTLLLLSWLLMALFILVGD